MAALTTAGSRAGAGSSTARTWRTTLRCRRPDGDDDRAARAATALGPYLSGAEVLGLLAGAIRAGQRRLAIVCLEALGRTIEVRTIPPGQPLPGLPDVVSQLAAGLDAYDSPLEMAEMAASFGVRLTSLEEFVRRQTSM